LFKYQFSVICQLSFLPVSSVSSFIALSTSKFRKKPEN